MEVVGRGGFKGSVGNNFWLPPARSEVLRLGHQTHLTSTSKFKNGLSLGVTEFHSLRYQPQPGVDNRHISRFLG